MEADPDLCGAFQLEKQLLCVRRAGTGTEETELCSQFSVGASEESEAASLSAPGASCVQGRGWV